jgi:hypothetical protein
MVVPARPEDSARALACSTSWPLRYALIQPAVLDIYFIAGKRESAKVGMSAVSDVYDSLTVDCQGNSLRASTLFIESGARVKAEPKEFCITVAVENYIVIIHSLSVFNILEGIWW